MEGNWLIASYQKAKLLLWLTPISAVSLASWTGHCLSTAPGHYVTSKHIITHNLVFNGLAAR